MVAKKLPTIERAKYDCTACGLCCAYIVHRYWDSASQATWVAVTKKDAAVLENAGKRHLVVLNVSWAEHFMEMTKPKKGTPSRCAALEGTLGVSVSCGVYEARPAVCREFEPGGKSCRAQRWRAEEIGLVQFVNSKNTEEHR